MNPCLLPFPCSCLLFQSDHCITFVLILPEIIEFNHKETFLYGISYKITGHIIQKCQSHERQGNVESSFRLKETKEIQQPMQHVILGYIFLLTMTLLNKSVLMS